MTKHVLPLLNTDASEYAKQREAEDSKPRHNSLLAEKIRLYGSRQLE
jgi:hypothetical protein